MKYSFLNIVFFIMSSSYSFVNHVIYRNLNYFRMNVHKDNVQFPDIIGYDDIKEELLQYVDLIKNQDQYQEYDIKIPKGILLEGPPGNGKTLIAKAFSNVCNFTFIYKSGSDFDDKYIGTGSNKLRKIFKEANDSAPSIIFIDEIDSIGRSRSSESTSAEKEKDTTLNQLLTLLDGFETYNVFLIGATNRGDLLDNALLRSGRLDKKIYIGNPNSIIRKQLIEHYTKKKPISDSIKLDILTEMSSGLSIADIENVFNEAMLLSLRNNRKIIDLSDIELSLSKIRLSHNYHIPKYSNLTKLRICTHEVGHALSATLLYGPSACNKACLTLHSPEIPGYTSFNIDTSLANYDDLKKQLIIMLSGKNCEKLFFQTGSSIGCHDDLNKAKMLAYKMVSEYGMGDKIFSGIGLDSKNDIDKNVETLLNGADIYSIKMLKRSLSCLNDLIQMLYDNHSISGDDISYLLKTKYKHLFNYSLS